MLRFLSRRKSPGRRAAPTHFTSAGRADRIRIFPLFDHKKTVGQNNASGVCPVGHNKQMLRFDKTIPWVRHDVTHIGKEWTDGRSKIRRQKEKIRPVYS